MRSRAEAIADVGKMAFGAFGASKIYRPKEEDMSRIALSAGAVDKRALRLWAVAKRHLDPYHHSSAQHHNDVTFWLAGNQLYWSNGSINLAHGVSFALNGGTQSSPNTGVSALLSGQSNPAGNYIVLNSTGSSMTVFDPGISASVTIPAYSASGGTGGQTTGFGVLSSAFSWQAREGGGSASLGPPQGLIEIGKIDSNADAVSGQYALKTRHGSGVVEAQHIREGGIAAKHMSVGAPLALSGNVTVPANSLVAAVSAISAAIPVGTWDAIIHGSWQFRIFDQALGPIFGSPYGQCMGYIPSYAEAPANPYSILWGVGPLGAIVNNIKWVFGPPYQNVGIDFQIVNLTSSSKTVTIQFQWTSLSAS